MSSYLTPPSASSDRSYQQLVRDLADSLGEHLPENPADLVFSIDLDGTLATGHSVSRRAVAALHRAREAGAQVIIATGRGAASTAPIIGVTGLRGVWSVCVNGAVTAFWDGSNRGQHRVEDLMQFDPRPAALAINQALPQALLAVDRGGWGLHAVEDFPLGEDRIPAADLEDLLGEPAAKLVAYSPEMDREEFVSSIAALQLEDVEYSVGWSAWADFGPVGVSKATGLETLSKRQNFKPGNVVAIGDGMNDLSMFAWAGTAVAMAGADALVRSHTDAVTGSVEEDGAAAVIDAVLARY